MSVSRTVLIACCALISTSCGSGAQPISFDSVPPTEVTSQSLPASSTAGVPAESGPPLSGSGAWVDVTGNLAGLESECGNLSLVSARPDRDAVIAGVAKQGLWVSDTTDGTWRPIGRSGGSTPIDNRATSIVYDPADPNQFWESGIYGGAVFETTDDGQSFGRLGDLPHADLVSVDLTDPNRRTLVAGVHEQPRVFSSSDGGQTWSERSAGLPPDVGFASFPHVIDATTFLLGTRTGLGSGVFRSTDGGVSWAKVYPAGVSGAPAIAPSGRIYWLRDDGGGVIWSDDNGATWSEHLGRGPVGSGRGSVLVLPDGRLATFGGFNVLLSDDEGTSWRNFGPTLPFAPNGMTFSAQRQAFYVWHFYCDAAQPNNPVNPQSIMRLDLEGTS